MKPLAHYISNAQCCGFRLGLAHWRVAPASASAAASPRFEVSWRRTAGWLRYGSPRIPRSREDLEGWLNARR
jgi:hypothetical protein